MSLCCHETGQCIPVDEDVLCGTRAERAEYSAVRHTVIALIPQELRRPEPCGQGDGIDIHHAHPRDNGGHSYSLFGGRFGEFAFSVDAETAQKHLPKCYKTYGLVVA